jgi:hypothetical protein
MRIPENRAEEVRKLIGRGGLESVTKSKHEIVTESFESVTESKAESIEDIRRIVERWGRSLCPIRRLAARSSSRGGRGAGRCGGSSPGLSIRAIRGGVLSPIIVLEEAINVCGQVAEEIVKGIGCQKN